MKDELMKKLKARYFNLVKKGLQIQKKGDIKAFVSNAIETEQIAQEMQQLSRTK
jgi:hypothetical protein